MRTRRYSCVFFTLFFLSILFVPTALAASAGDVVINDLAWMGTTSNTANEWIELYNTTGSSISLSSWTLSSSDGTPSITLTGSIAAYGYYLLERTDDNSVPGITADKTYAGAMGDGGELMTLKDGSNNTIDTANQAGSWFFGTTSGRSTMSRVDVNVSGTTSSNWFTATTSYGGGIGNGTPKAANVLGGTSDDWFDLYFTDHLNTIEAGLRCEDDGQCAHRRDRCGDDVDRLRGLRLQRLGRDHRRADRGEESQCDHPRRRRLVRRRRLSVPLHATVVDEIGNVHEDDDDRIMHNKFFVIDGRWVWTGSTNISRPEIDAEYYGDVSVLIDNTQLAGIYTTEFLEMYNGEFHTDKEDDTTHVLTTLSDGTKIKSYFAPTDDAETNAIVAAINLANTKVNMRTFFLTSTTIVNALKAAKDRGATVRVILDAASAHNVYSLHASLRSYGISVKVENWGGTEHCKAFSVDGYIVVLGSQNFTGSGNTSSDENTLYIENRPMATAFDTAFNTAWNSISNTWLTADPDPESSDSPGSLTDLTDNDHDNLTDELAPEQINNVSSSDGAINVYFLRQAIESGATTGNEANYNVNLEDKLTARLATATTSIDLATYELDLPDVVDELIDRAKNGVQVRIIADAKDPLNEDLSEDSSYKRARVYYERILRGDDGTIGTSDDGHLMADSAIFAVEDSTFRTNNGLPSSLTGLTQVTVKVGTATKTGYILGAGELKDTSGGMNNYYSWGDQMHNKFAIVDGTWVFTGSWNFTINDTYGSEANRTAGVLSGHTNHAVEIYSEDLADEYTNEFEEMWGSSTATPNHTNSNFHGRKMTPPAVIRSCRREDGRSLFLAQRRRTRSRHRCGRQRCRRIGALLHLRVLRSGADGCAQVQVGELDVGVDRNAHRLHAAGRVRKRLLESVLVGVAGHDRARVVTRPELQRALEQQGAGVLRRRGQPAASQVPDPRREQRKRSDGGDGLDELERERRRHE